MRTNLPSERLAEDFEIDVVPKVNLHEHFGGAVSIETYRAFMLGEDLEKCKEFLLPERGREIHSVDDITDDELREIIGYNPSTPNLADFQDHYGFASRLVNMQLVSVTEHAAYWYAKNAIDQNIRYAELRLNPFLGKEESSPDDLVDALIRGIEKVNSESNGKKLEYGLIFSALRHVTPEKNAHHVANEAIKQRLAGKPIVGVDLAGPEANFPVTRFESYFEIIKAHNAKMFSSGQLEKRIGITVHAGETPECAELSAEQSVREAISLAYDKNTPIRIGHGVLVDLNTMIFDLKEKNIGIEMCPTANLSIGAVSSLDNYPALPLSRRGVKVSVCSDNAAIFNTSVARELHNLQPTIEDLRRVTLDSLDTAFIMNDTKRQEIIRDVTLEFDSLSL